MKADEELWVNDRLLQGYKCTVRFQVSRLSSVLSSCLSVAHTVLICALFLFRTHVSRHAEPTYLHEYIQKMNLSLFFPLG